MAAARKPSLRAVQEGEVKSHPLSVSQAAATGEHRALLVAMRERIAMAVSDPDCPPRDLAALTRRLQEIAKEIAAIDLQAAEEAHHDARAADETWDEEAI